MTTEETTSWPSDWLRAVLGLSVLRVLDSGRSYGYAITSTLADAGLGQIKGGTLYPLLTRFETAGWVSTDWQAGTAGPGRKYFSLTEAGRAELARQRLHWQAFAAVTNNLFTGDPS
ncbi:PadR family transcriptional regulator [Specibacter sp. NPDC078709]|uniref:PadR family transcriptional regulator n=1 Tax=Specibacter sp. NPDC078709 TaxID=3154364 RepID=UPI003430889D